MVTDLSLPFSFEPSLLNNVSALANDEIVLNGFADLFWVSENALERTSSEAPVG